VIWVAGGYVRSYRVLGEAKVRKNKTNNFRIRQYSNIVIPNPELEEELIQLTAKKIIWWQVKYAGQC
jgi:hypothetical protein